MKRIVILAAVFQLSCGSVFSGITLTFDNPPFTGPQDPYSDGDVFTESGYQLRTDSDPGSSGSFIRVAPSVSGSFPYNGTTHVGITLFANVHLEQSSGNLFNIESIDLGEYSTIFNVRNAVTFEGVYADGSTVEETFSIDRLLDGPGGIDDFETVQFSSGWTGLQRVNFLTDGFSFDNIVVSVVPEPGSLMLFLSGMAALFIRRSIVHLRYRMPTPGC